MRAAAGSAGLRAVVAGRQDLSVAAVAGRRDLSVAVGADRGLPVAAAVVVAAAVAAVAGEDTKNNPLNFVPGRMPRQFYL